ncbi:EGF-like repeat and discoidin I-like domain-containing protein 3 [Ylistrum balloti]|uniref:EGF-like repeat and discoidin I-like domain-containing protein 3 n=1 Tax=Ylistrum balloti TaxID=509963 RepID=UPI002905D946|nr:EGF-like repeat and discoidin I-like domain-containing protein 3 [Ylistrum balloti]
MAALYAVFILLPTIVTSSFFQVNYPNVNISSEPNGDLIFEAGKGGDVILKPGAGGTVYIAGRDLRKFIQKVKSLPPIWTKQSVHGSLGTFSSGNSISVSVEAKDPDGQSIVYELVSGHLPPGTTLNNATGVISGSAPDVDATYHFEIRATDVHGKYADGSFSISIREQDQCKSNPCEHGGTCTDNLNDFSCKCTQAYGGDRCETLCSMNAFGVDQNVKLIPDAQISAHLTYSTYNAHDGRLNSNSGWIGNGSGSYLQVDLGNVTRVFGIATQSYRSSSYYTLTYQVTYSRDGNIFTNATGASGNIFSASASYDSIIKHDLMTPVVARFVRFYPRLWHTGGKPGLRVEVYGCY